MRSTSGVLAPFVVVAACMAGEPRRTVEGTTGPARVDLRGGSPVHLETRGEYESRAANDRYRVPAERDPWRDDPNVGYGFVGHDLDGRVTFAVRVFDAAPPQVLADENVNGDLRDDTVRTAVPFERGHGVDLRVREPAVPVRVQISRSESDSCGQAMDVVVMEGTLRDGKLTIDNQEIAFAVEGLLGRYGEEWLRIYLDIDVDGELEMSLHSDEAYTIGRDEYVNLAGRSWNFSVSPDGARLILTCLAENRPARARLAPGNPAPDFTFDDIEGATGRFSDYRGRVTLLYFWGTWCGPCRGETPYLREAYERFRDRGFVILAVAKKDTVGAVRAYSTQQGIPWRQVVDGNEGPIVTLYRAAAIPTAVLVDREGRIVAAELRGATIVEEVARAVGAYE